MRDGVRVVVVGGVPGGGGVVIGEPLGGFGGFGLHVDFVAGFEGAADHYSVDYEESDYCACGEGDAADEVFGHVGTIP